MLRGAARLPQLRAQFFPIPDRRLVVKCGDEHQTGFIAMLQFSNGFLLSLSLCLDIGLANIAMITLAMQRGYFHGFWLGIGTCVGDLIYALLALAGMAVVLQFTMVRWILWIGGGILLLWFAGKMLLAALRSDVSLPAAQQQPHRSLRREFSRGIVLAMSSPSAILWFASVGGALIARMGHGSLPATSAFLSGFFIAGVVWTCAMCAIGNMGGKLLGQRLLKYSYLASALIFCYFAAYVMVSGYREFVLGQGELPGVVAWRGAHHFAEGIDEMTLIVKSQLQSGLLRMHLLAQQVAGLV